MPLRYPIYTHRRQNQAFHDLQGGLILFGGLIFVVGMLVLHWEMIVLGSGMVVSASLCSLCALEDYYYQQRYEGVNTDQLERGESEVSE